LVIDSVSEAVSKRGIWVIDRRGDRRKILEPLLDRKLRFLIRFGGTRPLESGDQLMKTAIERAYECRCPYRETVVREKDGSGRFFGG